MSSMMTMGSAFSKYPHPEVSRMMSVGSSMLNQIGTILIDTMAVPESYGVTFPEHHSTTKMGV